MSLTDNSFAAAEGVYQRQASSFRRTRAAILDGAKSLVSQHGVSDISMVDIADVSEVSRATLYNHFRDKGSLLRALVESEIERIFVIAESKQSPVDALFVLSEEISSNTALDGVRRKDPAILTNILSHTGDSLWEQLRIGLSLLMQDQEIASIASLWLIGQTLQPISVQESRAQATKLLQR
ncbi:MAG: TetR/AcrR family transcriptional regulator [Actinomycetota bacterium]